MGKGCIVKTNVPKYVISVQGTSSLRQPIRRDSWTPSKNILNAKQIPKVKMQNYPCVLSSQTKQKQENKNYIGELGEESFHFSHVSFAAMAAFGNST